MIIFFALAEPDMPNSRRILTEAFNFIREQNVVDTLANVSSRDKLIDLIYFGGKND